MLRQEEVMRRGEELFRREAHEVIGSAAVSVGKDERGQLEEGDAVELTLGPYTYCPVRYHPFVVGPLTARSVVRHGESAEQAYARVRVLLTRFLEVEFEVALKHHLDRMVEIRRELVAKRIPQE